MKIISFNVNGLRARLHQLEAVINQHNPDIIGIQESKVHDDEFPEASIKALGYEVVFHGQKGHYGVCLLSKKPLEQVQKGFATEPEDAQRRMIMGNYTTDKGNSIFIMNGYFPQGENKDHPIKFPYKRQFYADLQTHLETYCNPEQPIVIMGDLNISAQDIDIGIGEVNRIRWLKTGKTSFQPEERQWYNRLEHWGLKDSFRHLYPTENQIFSWFDYRSRGFNDVPKRGLRIDAIMLTQPLIQQCKDAGVDYAIRAMEKPSDHAPVWVELEI